MTAPRLLDLCCCAGGAAKGYADAGFDVTGVDIRPRPNYPFKFVLGDALDAMTELGQSFHLIHWSTPCQTHSTLTKGTNQGRFYIDLIPQARQLAAHFGVDTVMENVPGSPLRPDLKLCGEMFDLGVLRHRVFEATGWGWDEPLRQPDHRPHRGPVRGWNHGTYTDGPYIAAYGKGGGKGTVAEMQQAMGITWTDVHEELTEAIPPAYTEYIGREWLRVSGWGAAERGEPDTWPVPECVRPYWQTRQPASA